MPASFRKHRKAGGIRALLRRLVLWSIALLLGWYGLCIAGLVALKWINPPTTGIQIQRRIESLLVRGPYKKRYQFVPAARISRHLRHAVIAAEDTRFYQHRGIDWKAVQEVAAESLEEGEVPRGASTITQQLVKNLFLTTHRSAIRKALEFSLVPFTELILSKDRILELYLNVVEFGPGVFGAEAAAQYHYKISASDLSREQAARLAAILPSPRKRKPNRMDRYAAIILQRMRIMGW